MTLISELVRHDKPLVTGSTAIYPYHHKLEKLYRFTSRFGEEVSLCSVEELEGVKYLHLPRALCPIADIDDRVDGAVVDFPNEPKPLPRQVEIFKEVDDCIAKGMSGQVSAYTGWGKTVLGYRMAWKVRRKTLVITTKEDIYQQWIDGACGRVSGSNPDGMNFLGLQWHEVGEIRQDKCEIVDTKFVVAMVHSLCNAEGKYPDWIDKEFGLVIYDEGHRMPAEQFSKVMPMFRAKYRWVLSATLERADGKEMLLHAHVGPVRAKTTEEAMVPKVFRYKTQWQVPKRIKHDKITGQKTVIKLPHQPGKTMHIEVMMAKNDLRNQLLVGEIVKAYQRGRKQVVFSSTKDHLVTMHHMATLYGVPDKDMGIYGPVTSKKQEEAREKVKVCPIIWTTPGMMKEGTNIPWLDLVVLAMPWANVTQMIGRVRRVYPDKPIPAVLDFMDLDSGVFHGYAAKRMQWYKSIGCEVIDMD